MRSDALSGPFYLNWENACLHLALETKVRVDLVAKAGVGASEGTPRHAEH
jgi:hypothetical protein